MKKATTYEEQLARLKSRGMIIDIGDDIALSKLSDIGYYRLGFFFFPFETTYPNLHNRTHKFKDESKISHVLELHSFDSDLRSMLLFYLNRIEINFRTKLIYECSHFYIDDPLWYINDKYVYINIVEEIKKEYDKKIRKFGVIKCHHKQHVGVYAPAWKTLEFITFGKALDLYSNLTDNELKNRISKLFGINSFSVLENYFTLFVSIRNICAHNNTLFDYNLPKSIKSGPALKATPTNCFKLNSVFLAIEYILSQISNECAVNFNEEIEGLFETYKSVPIIVELVANKIK